MTIKLRCPHCQRYFSAPDLESVKTYAASGGMIQTLTERIVMQTTYRHYVTPGPLWLAFAVALPPAFLAPAAVLYYGVDPVLAGGTVVACLSIGLVIASTQVEQTEIEDDLPSDDEPDAEPVEPQPAQFVEVTRPGKNSLSIRLVHEPPASADPTRQRTLGQADLALAKLATGINPISPISLAEARKRGYKFGEPAFYDIQRRWLKEGLAFKSAGGAVYLKPTGRKALSQYAER